MTNDPAGLDAGSAAPRDVILLGSTGSIGTQAADVIRRNPSRFRVVALAAGGGNPELLAAQAIEFGVRAVAVERAAAVPAVQEALTAQARAPGPPGPVHAAGQGITAGSGQRVLPEVLAGPEAVADLAARPADVVLNAITGFSGLAGTLAALRAGRTLALANKESLIAGGPLVCGLAQPGQIIPVDSEHSAIAQCLRGWETSDVRRLVLTASGGPFRGRTRQQLEGITPAQALAHPTWQMGPMNTINSATLVNKGLEVIEAHLLFGLPFSRIEVVVHPQSVVHSMVEFTDGSALAQASPPDMRIPIALGLAWPGRVPGAAPAIDWTARHSWTFEPLDTEAFPAVAVARQAGEAGGTAPAVYNAANEVCAGAFLAGRLPFAGIVDIVARVVSDHGGSAPVGAPALTLPDVLAADRWARERASELAAAWPGRGAVIAVPGRGEATG